MLIYINYIETNVKDILYSYLIVLFFSIKFRNAFKSITDDWAI